MKGNVPMETRLRAEEIQKTFILHLQGGKELNVLKQVNLIVNGGECVALSGPSGIGKSTLLRILYANYKLDRGSVWVNHRSEWISLFDSDPWQVLDIRRVTIGYVSQFLRVIPRVPAIDVVMEPLQRNGCPPEKSRIQVEVLLNRLNISERLWTVSPTTFSGGEQQRINLARCFIFPYPILLLDEPTAALDEMNRRVVIQLIQEAKERGAAIVGVFHDREVREAVSTRVVDVAMKGIE
jgi:alpha-D-ribose 1-methylphosphonate 5-triphosphate synthase subunit PhnL